MKVIIFFLSFILMQLGAFILTPITSAAPPVFDTKSSSTNSSWQHTVGNHSNRILIVGTGDNPSSVRYNGIALTKFSISGMGTEAAMWYLINPPVGTYTITVTGGVNSGAVSYYNVNTISPIAQTKGTSGSFMFISIFPASFNPSLSMSNTTSNQVVVDTVGWGSGGIAVGAGSSASQNSGQTQLWLAKNGSGNSSGASYKTGANGSTSMGWSVTITRLNGIGGGQWSYGAVVLHSLPPPTPTFTPSPTPTPGPYNAAGNIFVDSNKNGVKDGTESNYSGTVTISSSRGTVANGTGTYNVTGLGTGAVTISAPSIPSGYSMTYPLNGPPPSFNVSVGPGCTANGANSASCNGNNIMNLNFGISNQAPWHQIVCGDVRMDHGITNLIPATAITPYYITTNATCSEPGVAMSGAGFTTFGEGNASTRNWVAGGSSYPELYSPSNPSGISTSYDAINSKAIAAGLTTVDLSTICSPANCTLPPNLAHGIYKANGDVSINAFTAPANQNYVFLINGNLTLRGAVSVPTTSTVMFAASGNITAASTIGVAPNSTVSSLEGIFSTDKSFILPSAGGCTDQRLNIAGNLVINASHTTGALQNLRDLCGNNATYPSVAVTQRLDFLLNLPEFLKVPNIVSREGLY